MLRDSAKALPQHERGGWCDDILYSTQSQSVDTDEVLYSKHSPNPLVLISFYSHHYLKSVRGGAKRRLEAASLNSTTSPKC